jgi:hypothetical protein
MNPCSVPRTTRARGCPANRSSRRINSLTGQATPLAGEAGVVSPPLDDRVKKGAAHYLNSYPFPLPLSLSCYRDRERGYFERDPSPRRKRAPNPPTDQGFEGWPLGRVRQPPQSTRAPRLLLIRCSKAGPSEGFDIRPRARRARDDPGYVHYMAEARATLPRYPRTFPRPAGTIL